MERKQLEKVLRKAHGALEKEYTEFDKRMTKKYCKAWGITAINPLNEDETMEHEAIGGDQMRCADALMYLGQGKMDIVEAEIDRMECGSIGHARCGDCGRRLHEYTTEGIKQKQEYCDVCSAKHFAGKEVIG